MHHTRPSLNTNCHDKRYITLRLPFPKVNYIYIISVYLPVLDTDEEAKNQIHRQLSSTIINISGMGKFLLLGGQGQERIIVYGKTSSVYKTLGIATPMDIDY